MKRELAILVITLLAGCASMEGHTPEEWSSIEAGTYKPPKKVTQEPRLTREEWLKCTSRTYEGLSKDQIISAAEAVLRLAGGEYMKISHTEDGLTGSRSWGYYAVIQSEKGIDSWIFKTEPTQGGIKATVRLTSSRQLYSYGILPTPEKEAPVDGSAIYDMFWRRMDYLLGKTDKWTTCEMSEEMVDQGLVWGETKALCSVLCMANQTPAGPIVQASK
jgi:hypothetical protein